MLQTMTNVTHVLDGITISIRYERALKRYERASFIVTAASPVYKWNQVMFLCLCEYVGGCYVFVVV